MDFASGRVRPGVVGGATRMRTLQVLLLAGAILVLAGLLTVSITTLRRHADRARQTQVLAANLTAATQQVSRIEWEATALNAVSGELRKEHEQAHRRTDRLLSAYLRVARDPGDRRRLTTPIHRYLGAIDKELSLLAAGRAAQSARVDAQQVDPSFEALQRQLRLIDAASDSEADRIAGRTDVGMTASLLLAALALIVVLSRLDAVRRRAARERHEELEVLALHDALTGLPNRRQLLQDLEDELVRVDGGRRSVLMLCDLDGFKSYNDTFGHLEGDLLLARLGGRLARAAASHGVAYRLGGDEFCALLRIDDKGRESALAACHDALSESGSDFEIGASIGSVVLPEEASDIAAALRLADQRMYIHKNGRDSSIKRHLRELIVRVVEDEEPELHEHARDVAGLAAGVGRTLGLNDPEVADLVRAAGLHDVGKAAIPYSILHKPGPLDAQEQEFVRHHTLVGENILNAARALTGVGRLVRSSHERYDGSGYPDGLRAQEIPLASRIIFVCDSFHAMTTDRPYGRAMSDEDALVELSRCASTQFDPTVVDAFVAEFARLRAQPEPQRTAAS
jgi:diguanylate cyclase (GGDEF)-like protein